MILLRIFGCFALAVWAFTDVPSLAQGINLAEIEQRLQQSETLRANFVQQRRLRILTRPLTTSGTMTLAKGRGLLWRVRKPQVVHVLIRDGAFFEWDENGAPRHLATSGHPVFATLSATLIDALSGNLSALSQSFFISIQERGDTAWAIMLKPRQPKFADLVKVVVIQGDRAIESIGITETGGDVTDIMFSNTQYSSQALSPEEALFLMPLIRRPD